MGFLLNTLKRVPAGIALLLLPVAFAAVPLSPPITYIDIGGLVGPRLSLQREFSVQVCAGIFNRDQARQGAVYTLGSARDLEWLVSTKNNDTVVTKASLTDPMDFLRECLRTDYVGRARGRLRYSWSAQKSIVPNLVTLAAVLDAVPLEDSDVDELNVTIPVIFDAIAQFPDSLTSDTQNAPRVVTAWVFDHYGNHTSGMAKMNPGLDVHGKNKVDPPLLYDPELGLVDYIVRVRMFNFFLYLGCVPLTDDHKLMERLATANSWPRPLRVMGYDDTIAAAGDIFEAETNCVREHNMGQIASNGCSNLSFYSGRPGAAHRRVTEPLLQVPDPPSIHEPFNASLTYLSILMGDGDNVNFVKGSRRDWMEKRVAACGTEETGDTCFPLVWTLSPAALYLAPDFIRWYYEQSQATQRDWFVLPPSGDTYSYPSEMSSEDQANFVNATEEDARLMNSSGTVSWEFFQSWRNAISHFFPRYARNGVIKACFAVNVPYFFPLTAFKKGEHYKILHGDDGSGDVVLFAPREWRGEGSTINPMIKPNVLRPSDMAAEISAYPKGTVTHIYATSDGGFDFEQLTQMVGSLGDHVRLVGANELTLRARQREQHIMRIPDKRARTKEIA
jgi:hypothetical protein